MQAKVARIISTTRLVINKGSKDDVEVEDVFEIYEEGEEIKDPDSQESLGKLEIIKGCFVVIYVQEMMCIAEVRKRTVTKTRYVNDLSRALSIFGTREESYDVTEPEKIDLERTDSDYTQKLKVRVGDKARLLDPN